jgi:hypothetical protein
MPKLLYYQKNNSVYFVNDDGVNPLDYSIGTFPVNSIKTSIDPTDTELIIFSHNQPSNAFEIIKKRFNEIADETGTLYAGANAVDVLDSINLAVGQIATTSGGGGSGGATEAKQDDQITEAVLQTNIQNATLTALPSIRTSGLATVAATEQMAANQINGSQVSKNYSEAVALGLIVDASGVNKSGENPDVDTGTLPEAVWNGGGAYTGFPTTVPVGGTELQVVSSSAADIGTLFITYLETSASTQYTTIGVPVNGVTPVNTGINAYRVHTAYYSSTANPSTQFNAGTIQVRYRQNNAVVFLAMPIGRNQTYMSGYTIPAGKKGLLLPTTWTVAGAAGNTISGAMYIREFNKSPRFRRNVKASFGVPARDEYTVPIVLPELTDVMPYVTLSNGNNIIAQALFDVILSPA